ncbi:hypothetical protein SISNIDRAFT_127728 [Sistotremastrum niveocremeum HHB9708]|uniref:Uncharacterized protein n=1 Tax=Sistotremastrum niveocremeum HHB9708 TaxID=1314777 RepID=A0A164SYT3_9AGAM|nr:hypothetical protein SISNIDRAFT_127728 [Sistotremastrum niveocremeum HHB9708]
MLYPKSPRVFRKGGCSLWTNRNVAHWMLSLEEDWQCRNWSESEVICAFCEEKIPVGAGCRPKLAFWDAHKLTCSMEWPHDLATRPYDSLSENDRKLLALLKRSRSSMKKNGGG